MTCGFEKPYFPLTVVQGAIRALAAFAFLGAAVCAAIL